MENKMNINWYPGHMAKTKKQISDDLKLIDVVIEILDARIPISSQNPDIGKLLCNKKRIIALNKSDLANESQNKLWQKYFEDMQIPCVITDSNTGIGMKEILLKIEAIMQSELQKQADKGRIRKNVRLLIVGIPNVGKSSFINRIAKRNTANVGNKPGVTKQKQWIRIQNNIELLDTPGVLWPKFESEEVALHLAYTGTIKDEVIEQTEIAYHLLKFLYENYQTELLTRYKIEKQEIRGKESFLLELMHLIGKKRGALLAGGKIDEEKAAKILLDDFRNGKIGRITLEPQKQ